MKIGKIALLCLLLATLAGCKQTLDLNYFTMTVPHGWKYEPGDGTDSFKGTITTPSGTITFDYSTKGYAAVLGTTEDDFLADKKNWTNSTCYFCKAGDTIVQYSTTIRRPDARWQHYYTGADYIADLKYKDSTIYVPITIPHVIKDEYMHADTTKLCIIKTIWPKTTENGVTGVYIKSLNTPMNFNMQGSNLSKEDETAALAAFKTIKLKE
jgi:hypothetical protein